MRWMTLGISIGLSLLVGAEAATAGLPASGQKKCWDATGAPTPCAGTGHDGDLRAGDPLDLDDGGDGTILDRNTGLAWEKLSRQGGVHDRDAVFTWDQAFAKLEQLNEPPCFAGYCDWRMPNAKELQSLADYQKKAPAIPKAFSKQCTPGCTVLQCSCTPRIAAGDAIGFWSSTSNAGARSEAWQLVHATGALQSVVKAANGSMRAVRGGRPCTRAIATLVTGYSSGGSSISGVTVDLDYPEDAVVLPGTGSGGTVAERIENLSGVSGLFQVSDDDDVAGAGLVNLSQSIPAGVFVRATFDCVAGQAPPSLADFACTATAADFLGLNVPATCAVSLGLE